MTRERVTVIGGSGFLGRRIVRRLVDDGISVRVAVRNPDRTLFPMENGTAGWVTPVRCDVWDEASVAPVVEGAIAVINTVGHYVERGAATFEAIHGQGAMHVAQAAAQAGVGRLVHISGLGADPASDSPYIRARGIGEDLVREAFPSATILRPSVVFGPEDAFFNRLAGLARILPVLPLFGRGETRLQPVFVGDVAEAVSASLANADTAGRTYALGGPGVYTYRELVECVLTQTGRRRLLMPVPFGIWTLQAAVLSLLPNPPLSRDQVKLMRADNVVPADALGLTDLGVTPTPVETVLPEYVR